MKKHELKSLLRDVVGDDVDGTDCDPGETIGRLTTATETTEPGPDSPPASDTPRGRETHYEVLQEIGRGGSGVVYRARQTCLMREVALKKVRKSQVDRPHARPAFISEALITGVLDHPNVVPIYDLIDTEDGESAIAMKRVCGISWKELLHPETPEIMERSRGLDRERHIEILIAVGNAVAYAHSKGILHRDLKPANVMIGDFGEVMVTDWGMAVVFDHSAATAELERQALTRSRETVTRPSGSPGYMAPEMALGKGDRLGPWTDVYLLGSILHEIITGRRPHEGSSLYRVVEAAFQSAPPEFENSVPEELQEICRKAMNRRIKSRYQSVEQLQQALRSYLEHRESWQIAGTADQTLASFEARWEGRATRSGRRIKDPRDYTDLAEALAGYRHALVLWRGNEIARQKELSTRLLYARTAYQAEDFGLTLSLVEGLDDPRGLALADAARSKMVGRLRSDVTTKRLRLALVAAAAVVVAILLTGFITVSQERDRADRSAAEAIRQNERANEFARQAGAIRRARDRGDLEAASRERLSSIVTEPLGAPGTDSK